MEFGLVAVWLVALLLLGLLARPASAWLFPSLDHGALAFPLGIAVLGVVGHLVGHLAFGWPAALAGLVVLVLMSARVRSRVELDRPDFIEAAAVFALAFLFMTAIRSFQPAAAPLPVAIGEKMLDLGLLESLLRAPRLPPEDMWFAGEAVRYHYGGHLLAALLATVTGTAGRFAYNLALAGFYATLVVAAYGLAGSIAMVTGGPRRPAGAFGAFLVGVAGNLDSAGRVLIWLAPDPFAAWLASGLGYDTVVLEWTPMRFFYFDASRVFPIDASDPNSFMAATEFPLFAWLNGDLHAHMMSQPLMLLAGAILLATWQADTTRRRILLLGVLPPLAGFISVVNVWSFPTVLGLVVLALAFNPEDPLDLLRDIVPLGRKLPATRDEAPAWYGIEARRFGAAVLIAGLVAVLGVLWTLPYWLLVVFGGPGMGVHLWGPWTPLGGFLRVQGGFLAILGLYTVGTTAVEAETPRTPWAIGLAMLGGFVLLGVPAFGFVLPLGLGAWWVLRRRSDAGFEWILVLAGCGLIALVELVAFEGERFNTVFKYYAHVWLFWAIAAGVAMAKLQAGWPAATANLRLPRWRTVSRLTVAGVVLLTSIYAGMALPAHFDNPGPAVEAHGPTIDSTAYVAVVFPTEAPAIEWLGEQSGRPTIVTAAPGGYWWRPDRGDGSAAPASLTGLPTVLGWFHERQYRGLEDYQQRIEHVRTIYTGDPDSQRALLKRYDVKYVYVGPAERAKYSQITVGSLEGVVIAKQWEGVTIYRVEQSSL